MFVRTRVIQGLKNILKLHIIENFTNEEMTRKQP